MTNKKTTRRNSEKIYPARRTLTGVVVSQHADGVPVLSPLAEVWVLPAIVINDDLRLRGAVLTPSSNSSKAGRYEVGSEDRLYSFPIRSMLNGPATI